ncbi:uncharacterized protein LOC115889849 isoform X2 [Sitophilus oryzae]|uniref:Uncharacterized protein LOC115889849 isoform X2 n=1 Tax=Sitophilus oryzae TaxID=7048 RepID=A0A6J2YSN3_SITOR|nr:uncharacterized protein LOC115889849 isoform X2 [Sitophilus oryzae]
MTELQNGLPPGWDCLLDERTGKRYYVNHFTKATTWEDPRNRHRLFQNTAKQMTSVPVEHIPLQHGSPEFKRNHVYPSHPPPIHAFQMNSKAIQMQDMKPITRSPLTLRNGKVKDSSFNIASSQCSTDIEDSVAKLSAMFPTVSETHIKLLLKKYLNREALVISALQVEKYPITTPGPFSTPPPQRNIHVNIKGGASNTGSPILRGLVGSQGFRNSPKPHSSPKLKLRYMKSIFPNADETIILEVLQNNENSIQKSSDVLKDMGYNKKDTMKPPIQKVETATIEKVDDAASKYDAAISHIKTNEEKQLLKGKLKEQYKDVAEHLITIALESVNFDENRASQILNIMKQEDSENNINNHKHQKKEEDTFKTEANSACLSSQMPAQLPISQSRQSIKSLLKVEKRDEIGSYCRIVNENNHNPGSSKHLCNTVGHNSDFTKGPNEKLLLENYVQWQGSNKTIQKGPQGLAKGPNKSLLSNKLYTPCGPNADFHTGPAYGLAKGSIFNQLNKAAAVIESRVK